MDFSPLFQTLLSFWYLFPLIIFAAILKSSWFKGLFGEFVVNVFAKWTLDKNTYHLFKNVTLPTEDGTTQIDHIIVSVYGVFVIETKNLRGWIFGHPNQKTWTQKIYKSSYKIQNPLHQNQKHTATLRSLLGLSDEQIFSVIVFVGDSEFKTWMPSNVTQGLGFIRYIRSKTLTVLKTDEVEQIIKTIEAGRLEKTLKTRREHIKHVQSIVTEKPSQKRCPKCGSKMVLRTAMRGTNKNKRFWGCTTFPKCRGLIAYENER